MYSYRSYISRNSPSPSRRASNNSSLSAPRADFTIILPGLSCKHTHTLSLSPSRQHTPQAMVATIRVFVCIGSRAVYPWAVRPVWLVGAILIPCSLSTQLSSLPRAMRAYTKLWFIGKAYWWQVGRRGQGPANRKRNLH